MDHAEYILTYGKHQGEKLKKVPASYLLWAWYKRGAPKELASYVNKNYDRLIDEKDHE